MAAQKGSAFLLKDNSTGTAVTLGGMRSTSMSINGEIVDITTFTDSASEETTRVQAFSGDMKAYDLVFEDGSSAKGTFIVSSYERAGEYNGEETYSLSLESSGTITWT